MQDSRYFFEIAPNIITVRYLESLNNANSHKKQQVISYLIVSVVTAAFSTFLIITGYYVHAALFFIILGLGGGFLVHSFGKRIVLRYVKIIFDDCGVHEIWDIPKKYAEKSIRWDSVECFLFVRDFYRQGAYRSQGTPMSALVISEKALRRSAIVKLLRKTYNSSAMYEKKFLNVEHIIILIFDNDKSFEIISDFASTRGIEIKIIDGKTGDGSLS